jgi:hypothetical protein
MADLIKGIRNRCIANEKTFDNEDMSNVLHALEHTEGDLRQLASWVDSVLSGNSPHVEQGSSIYTILQRWK